MTRLAKTVIRNEKPTKPRLALAGVDAPAGASLPTIGAEDVLTGAELSKREIESLFATAQECAADRFAHAGALAGRSVALLFEKPSLRTRVTFEVGLHRLGAQAIFLDHEKSKIGAREAVKDLARNLERWCDALVCRVDRHETLLALADNTDAPVVNALCDTYHPCQALADYLTLRQKLGAIEGKRLAFVGDGNNVCHSLLLVGARLGVNVTVVTPPGFGPGASITQQAGAIAALTGGWIDVTTDLRAIAGADAVYTDAWASMGTAESPERLGAFARYQVNAGLMALAGPSALFMHCLPAHRGQEVTDEVIDSPNSVVYDQAENRLHAQSALLLHLLGRVQRGATASRRAGVLAARD